MKKVSPPASENITSRDAHLLGASPFDRLRQGKTIDLETLAEKFTEIENKLSQGLAVETEEICFELLKTYSISLDVQARLNRLLSLSFELQGRFEESVEVLKPFENVEVTEKLKAENLVTLLTQQAVSYANINEPKKAINLLNIALRTAEERDFTYLLTNIYIAFARIYRALNEHPVSRNYVEKAMKYAREVGDWRSLAEAYQISASGYLQEGNSQKSIELFQQGIKIIGDRSAPFLLGKLYSDISVAYSAVFRSNDGIESLKKAIGLFEKIGNQYQTAIAYNNLGTNLLLSGDWKKAEDFLNKAIDLALEINHLHLASFACSMGELNLLRGDYEEAEKLFTQSLILAEKNKKDWYSVQISYSLARCLLAQNKTSFAIKKAEETIQRCNRINENHFRLLTLLVLAESYFKQNKIREADEILHDIEENETSSNFSVQGNVARIRGLIALESKDETLAVHHFSRSLSIFEMAGDLYNITLANYDLGRALANTQPEKANKHLTSAIEVFRKLGVEPKIKPAEEILAGLEKVKVSKSYEQSVNSSLLMLRLIEAISSRELLFRELITILRQEGKAKKAILAELNGSKRFSPSIIDGFIPSESSELMVKLGEAQAKNDLDTFAKKKNLGIFHLRAPNAAPSILVVSPSLGATFSDGSSIQPLLRVVELGMEVCALRENGKDIPKLAESRPQTSSGMMPGFIHSSPAMMELVDEIQKIRTSDVTALITGESGTGKELIARAIHIVSKRKDKVFIPFNCTAVPKELTEGHLFGYKKGSFTGAVADSQGMIRSADGGTLFLDEIGDLPLDVQPKILRFLQEGEVQPLGEKAPKSVDVRIIAATNMNLEEKVMQGLFREDLYYRLNVIRLRVPPLRERRSEIPQLVNYYLAHYSAKFGRKDLSMTSEAMDLLISYNWQGNVRQLCNEVQRIVARADDGDKINPRHLSPEIKPMDDSTSNNITGNVRAIGLIGGSISIQTEGGTLDEAVSALEIQMITDSLKRHNKNISRVAKELGLTRRGLYLKLERYKLKEN